MIKLQTRTEQALWISTLEALIRGRQGTMSEGSIDFYAKLADRAVEQFRERNNL